MAKKDDLYTLYGESTAKERVKLIYKNYCTFEAIISDCKERLAYEIQSEMEHVRSSHKGELGVHIDTLGRYSNPTECMAEANYMLEESINSNDYLRMSSLISDATRQEFERKHFVIVMMQKEYCLFVSYINTLPPEDKDIVIPLITHSKDYIQLSEDMGESYENVRKRSSLIRAELIENMTLRFKERI